jgi:hypothetical protein
MANQDDLYDLSDDALEAAFKAARAEQATEDQSSSQEENAGDEGNVNDNTNDEQNDENDQNAGDDTQSKEEDNSSSSEKTDDNDGTEQSGDTQDSGRDVGGEGEKKTEAEADKTPKAEDKGSQIQAPTVHKFKANGKDYEITDEEMRTQFPKVFAQAMDYTKKTQQIAPWRKTIDALEQAKLGHADINLMIDVLKGDKSAIAEVLKRTSTDALDLTSVDKDYAPNDYGRDSRTLALQDVLESIKTEPEYAITSKILSTDWDDASWNVLSADPRKVQLLHNDVKSGVFAKVQRIADKQKVFNGGVGSDLDHYMAAAQVYYKEQLASQEAQRQVDVESARRDTEAAHQARINAAKAQEAQRKVASQASQARKAAAPSASSAKGGGSVNYLAASDEDFDEWYKQLQANS